VVSGQWPVIGCGESSSVLFKRACDPAASPLATGH
jgi:hypothetical protein